MLDWSWLEMVAQLDEDSMFEVVGNGLVRCEFSTRAAGPQLRVWDFVLWRADGSGIRLHPQWKQTKVATSAREGHAAQVQCPRNGLGRSDGRGTYAMYKRGGTLAMLKFDHNKRPLQMS